MLYRCVKCKRPCDLHTIDVGGYEEVWGAKIWHSVLEDVSDCCHDEIEVIDEENDDEI